MLKQQKKHFKNCCLEIFFFQGNYIIQSWFVESIIQSGRSEKRNDRFYKLTKKTQVEHLQFFSDWPKTNLYEPSNFHSVMLLNYCSNTALYTDSFVIDQNLSRTIVKWSHSPFSLSRGQCSSSDASISSSARLSARNFVVLLNSRTSELGYSFEPGASSNLLT